MTKSKGDSSCEETFRTAKIHEALMPSLLGNQTKMGKAFGTADDKAWLYIDNKVVQLGAQAGDSLLLLIPLER